MHGNLDRSREIEVLLKEYEIMRSEIVSRLEAQNQLTNITLLLIGGVTTAAPFLLSFNSQSLHLIIPPLYLILVFLVFSLLFTSLHWVFMWQNIIIGRIARYIEKVIKARLNNILGLEKTEGLLSWESYNARLLFPTNAFDKFMNHTASASLYVPMAAPALFTLIIAISAYFNYFTVLMVDISGWLTLVFIFFDLVYFIASLLSGVLVVRGMQYLVE